MSALEKADILERYEFGGLFAHTNIWQTTEDEKNPRPEAHVKTKSGRLGGYLPEFSKPERIRVQQVGIMAGRHMQQGSTNRMLDLDQVI